MYIFFSFLLFSTTPRCAYRTSFSHLNPTFFLLRHTHCLMDFYMLASCFLDPPRALHLTFDHDAAPILTYLVLHTLTHLFLYYFLFLTSTFPFIYSHYTFFFKAPIFLLFFLYQYRTNNGVYLSNTRYHFCFDICQQVLHKLIHHFQYHHG